MDKIKCFSQYIDQADQIVFFTGAGMSTASGIPDFRSAGGLFMEQLGGSYRPEEIVSHDFFSRYPQAYFTYHFDKLVYPEAQPNLGHRFIADLEDQGKQISVVTQNIDGLHQQAGSHHVFELHGTVLDNYCLTCGRHYRLDQLEKDQEGVPRCPSDGGIVRPNIVLYQENLPEQTVKGAVAAISQADLLVVLGTSLQVYPAAGFLNYFQGDHLVVVNKSPLSLDRPGLLVFEDSIENVFSQL
ncbi:NAD-dependent deacetylase [Aerococcus urinaehominis]|uniref:NAD-dependent deacetylase n=1 Tax=Aerococcus urinaehominis TaxID=128944 RepID=A0A109RGP8_9LACT|nr:NAD-dependent protein deacylase [Aerococcus urinaehominis]AMB99174.1 NAD-dependent deacetylase [Aerococcus urinaehominis]SDM06293.1 NAD-dependent deacetylase [Aerococcus urinaehominis]